MFPGLSTDDEIPWFEQIESIAHNFYWHLNEEEKKIYTLYKIASTFEEFIEGLNETHLESKSILASDYIPFFGYSIFDLGLLMKQHPNNIFLKYISDSLDNLSKKFTYDDEITLYRATCLEDIEGFFHNGVFIHPFVISSSYDQFSLHSKFRNLSCRIPVLLQIHCSPGTNMVPMEGIPGETHEEREMLLSKNAIMRLQSFSTVTSKSELDQIMGDFPMRWNELVVLKLEL